MYILCDCILLNQLALVHYRSISVSSATGEMLTTNSAKCETVLTQENESCPYADSVYRLGPSLARGFVCYVWPAGGHLG